MNENFEDIERYLRRKMSPLEAVDFEKKIAADSQLAFEVETQRFELETIDLLEEDTLREKLKLFELEATSGSAPDASLSESWIKKLLRPKYWSLVLVGLLVVLIIAFLPSLKGVFREEGSNESKRLEDKEKQEEPPQVNDSLRTVIALADIYLETPYRLGYKGPAEINLLRTAYAKSNYITVIQKADDLLADPKLSSFDSGEIFFLKGLSLLYSGNFLEAGKSLVEVISLPDPEWHDKARWFLALALLKNGQILESKEILKEIVQMQEPHHRQEDARSLLQGLEDCC